MDPDISCSIKNGVVTATVQKGSEHYEFRYEDLNREELYRVLGRMASNPDLSFSWYDAAVLRAELKARFAPVPLEIEPFEFGKIKERFGCFPNLDTIDGV